MTYSPSRSLFPSQLNPPPARLPSGWVAFIELEIPTSVNATPFQSTTESFENPAPATLIGVSGEPSRIRSGVTEKMTGVGVIVPIVKVVGADVSPPGDRFTAVNARVPVLATSAAVGITCACVALLTVVERPAPFTAIVVEATKPVPVTFTVRDAVFTLSADGLRAAIVGAGLSTSKFAGVPVPLQTDPFRTTTASCPPVVICAAGMTAVNFALLTYVVASLMPFTCTMDVDRNPIPFTVSVTAPDPAITPEGLIDETAGVGGIEFPPPEPEEDDPPPLQLAAPRDTLALRQMRKKRLENCRLNSMMHVPLTTSLVFLGAPIELEAAQAKLDGRMCPSPSIVAPGSDCY